MIKKLGYGAAILILIASGISLFLPESTPNQPPSKQATTTIPSTRSQATNPPSPAPSRTTPPRRTTTTSQAAVPPLEPTVNPSGAESVIITALEAAFTWHPATEAAPYVALETARPLMTDALAAQLFDDSASGPPGPTAQWAQWAEHNTVVTATVTLGCSGCPPDTGSAVHRTATIHQVAANDHATVPLEPVTAWVTVTAAAEGRWLLDSLTF